MQNVESKESNPFDDAVPCLANGVVKSYEPPLHRAKTALKELTGKQELLIDQVHQENIALSTQQYSDDLKSMFLNIEKYQSKLVQIKKDMKAAHEKSIKLKKRALKLQQFQEKQKLIKKQKEIGIQQEEDLIGRPSSSN